MSDPLTKTQVRIKEAKERGYYVTPCGRLFGPNGQISIKTYGKQRYPTFSTNWGGRVYGLPVHRFAAYIFFGEKAFEKGLQVRHLNADTTDISLKNIRLGSASDNQMDKPKLVRSNAAKLARKAQGFTPRNAKLNVDDVNYIRQAYEDLKGKRAPNGFRKELVNRFGVSSTVIDYVVKKRYYTNA